MIDVVVEGTSLSTRAVLLSIAVVGLTVTVASSRIGSSAATTFTIVLLAVGVESLSSPPLELYLYLFRKQQIPPQGR